MKEVMSYESGVMHFVYCYQVYFFCSLADIFTLFSKASFNILNTYETKIKLAPLQYISFTG